MTPRRTWSRLGLVVGILLAVISAFADQLGVARMPGFRWKQTLWPEAGLVVVIIGLVTRR